jgi:hypothetical protein
MTRTKTIKIAEDFSIEPAGRYYSDGPFSGQKFRKEYLIESLRDYDKVIVNFDGIEGSGSSFLDEAFAGLINKEGFSQEQLHNILELISNEDPSVIAEVWSYIDSATPIVKNAN